MVTDSADSVSVYGAKILLKHLKAMENELEGVITGGDIEYVHRCRVASRRMRAALAMFETSLPARDHKKLEKAMRAVTRRLGEARDTDAQIEVLKTASPEFIDRKLAPGIRRLVLRLQQKRKNAQAEVVRAVEKLEEKDVIADAKAVLKPLVEMSGEVYLYSPALYELGFNTIKGRLDELLAHEPFIDNPNNLVELHAMRISAKKLRYTLENFEEIYSGQVKEVITTMRALQDALGALHDLDVWISWIPQFILEERERVRAYFGNVDQLKRLLPGLQAFMVSRRIMRDMVYEDFIKLWKRITRDAVWDGLRKVISAPMDINSMLQPD